MFGSFPVSTDCWIGDEANAAAVPYVSPLGNAPALFNEKHTYVCGLTAGRSCILDSVLKAIHQRISPKPKTLVVLAADDADNQEEAACTVKTADQLGFELLSPSSGCQPRVMTHRVDGKGIRESVALIRDLAPDILCVVSDQANSIAVVEACESIGFRPGGIALSCGVTVVGFTDRLGAKANGLLGGVAWTSKVSTFAEDRFGSSEDYARGYFESYSEPASFYAALASAAGICLEQAVHCGCKDTRTDLIDRLRSLAFTSFVGPIRFNANGCNDAHTHFGVQLITQSGVTGDVLLWPLSFAGVRRGLWPRP